MGVYNEWVEKSLQKLAEFLPARYDKPEETSGIVSSLDTYIYEIVRPEPSVPPEPQAEIPLQAEQTETATEIEAVVMEQIQAPNPVTESNPETSAVAEETGTLIPGAGNEEVEQVEATDSVTVPETEPPVKTELPDSATEIEAPAMEQIQATAPVTGSNPEASAVAEETGTLIPGTGNEEVEQIETTDSVTEPETEPPVTTELPDSATVNGAVEMELNEESSGVSPTLPGAPEQLGEAAQMGQTTRR